MGNITQESTTNGSIWRAITIVGMPIGANQSMEAHDAEVLTAPKSYTVLEEWSFGGVWESSRWLFGIQLSHAIPYNHKSCIPATHLVRVRHEMVYSGLMWHHLAGLHTREPKSEQRVEACPYGIFFHTHIIEAGRLQVFACLYRHTMTY